MYCISFFGQYEETAKAIQCIVYRSLVKYEETAKAIQCIVYLPVVLHEGRSSLTSIEVRSVPRCSASLEKNCKHERVSTALVYSMYMCLTIDPGTLFNNSTEKLKDTR